VIRNKPEHGAAEDLGWLIEDYWGTTVGGNRFAPHLFRYAGAESSSSSPWVGDREAFRFAVFWLSAILKTSIAARVPKFARGKVFVMNKVRIAVSAAFASTRHSVPVRNNWRDRTSRAAATGGASGRGAAGAGALL